MDTGLALVDVTSNARDRHAAQVRKQRAEEKDLEIPPVKNPARRAAALVDVYAFLQTYFAAHFKNWSPSRREMVDAVFSALRTKTAQAIAAPRRDGKTTITAGVTAYCILRGLVRYGVLVGATSPTAEDLLENIKGLFERHKMLLEDFPEVCIPIRDVAVAPARAGAQTVAGSLTYVEWTTDRVVFPTVAGSPCSGAVLRAVGITSSMRGMNTHFDRPDLVIIDDPDDEESAASDVKTDKRVKKINQTIRGLAGEDTDIARVMLCTLINHTCAAARYTDRKIFPAWNGRRFKMIERMPDCCGSDNDLWAKYVDMVREDQEGGDPFARRSHAFYLSNREAMDAGAVVGNENRFYPDILEDGTQKEVSTLQQAFNLIADIGWDSFLTEYQNDPPIDVEKAGEKLSQFIVRGSAQGYGGRMNGLRRGAVPDGSRRMAAFVDIGDKLLTWEVVAEQVEGVISIVDYGKQATDSVSVVGVEAAVKRGLDDIWKIFRERKYNLAAGLIDSGSGFHTQAVYDWVRDNAGPWYPSKGDGKYVAPKLPNDARPPGGPARHWKMSTQPGCPRRLVVMDANHWKEVAHSGFMVKPLDKDGNIAKGCVRLFGADPHGHTDYAQEIVAEELVTEFVAGKGYSKKWVQHVRGNHYLDAHYGCLVALSVGRHLEAVRSAPAKRFGVLSKGV